MRRAFFSFVDLRSLEIRMSRSLLNAVPGHWRGGCVAVVMAAVLAAFAAGAAPATEPEAVPQRTIQRLLLTNATQAGKRIVAVGDQGYVIYSDDNGEHWLRGVTPRAVLLTAVRFVDDMHGWAVGHDGVILATTDGGAHWSEQRFQPDDEKPLLGIWFKDLNSGIAVGAYGLYLETADGGKTWAERAIIDEDKHLNAITAFGEQELAIAAEAGGLLISTDGGQTWRAATVPYAGSYFGVLALPDHALLAFGLRGKIFRSEDAGETWQAVLGAGELTLLGGAIVGQRVVLAGSAGSVEVSTDGGRSFSAVNVGIASAFSSAVITDAQHALLFGERGVAKIEVPAAGDAR